MSQPRRRKRYLLLSSDTPIDEDTQKEFTRLVFERYPDLEKRRVVWLKDSLIVRTDHLRLAEIEQGLALRVGETQLVTRRVSGSISKLKRLVGR